MSAEVQENIFQYQPDASLNQAAPVVDEWYTVLDTVTSSLKVYAIWFLCDTADTVEIRVTIDGKVYTISQVVVGGTNYYVTKSSLSDDLLAGTTVYLVHYHEPLRCNSIKVEIRVTTAGGGNLRSNVVYEKQW